MKKGPFDETTAGQFAKDLKYNDEFHFQSGEFEKMKITVGEKHVVKFVTFNEYTRM